jgi:NAD-dependent dihydropyrimidine dehydrogenase PreA subunit
LKVRLPVILALVFTLSLLSAGRPITYQINQLQCWVCGRCLFACSQHAIYYDDDLDSFQIDQSLCNGDGLCVYSCPHGAIHQVVSNDDSIATASKEKLSCFPNPMKDKTKLKYELATGHDGKIEIFNLKGQLVRAFMNIKTGRNELTWDGNDQKGNPVPSGCYFIKLSTDSKSVKAKIIKVR